MVLVKMRLNTQLVMTVSAAVALVVVVTEARVNQREVLLNHRPDTVSPLVPEESMITAQSHHLALQPIGRHWTSRNIYSGHYLQEEPDTSATYWPRRADRRYHSSGGPAERSFHRERVAAARHESREQQPRRVYATHSPAKRDSAWDPSSTSRMRISADERVISRVHQEDSEASTNDRRRLPHSWNSHESKLQLIPRREIPQTPLPDRPVENHYRASYSREGHNPSAPEEGYNAALANLSGSVGRPSNSRRHKVHETHAKLGSTALSMATTTRGDPGVAEIHQGAEHYFSEISNEGESDVRQRLEQPDLCCGSQVSFESRAALATGAFERVASAGSIKVVKVPEQSHFPPNEVRDLRVAPLDPHTLSLTWTAPGDDLDSGTASGYIIRLSEARHDLQESQFDEAPEETLLDTSEMLVAADVYQEAGTQVGVEVPVGRQLLRGHVYYVALKAVDDDGHSSGVSNLARFSVPESLPNGNTAPSNHTTAINQTWQGSNFENVSGASSSRGTVQTHREITIFSERTPTTPSMSSSDITEAKGESLSNGSNEEPSLLSTLPPSELNPSKSDGFEKQRKRNGKKDRRMKKKSKRRKGGRRNGRRNRERCVKNRGTSAQDSEECKPSEQEQSEPVSLCEAQYSLTLVITYFTQNNEHQYLDYLSAALHTLDQKMQPSWRAVLRDASPAE